MNPKDPFTFARGNPENQPRLRQRRPEARVQNFDEMEEEKENLPDRENNFGDGLMSRYSIKQEETAQTKVVSLLNYDQDEEAADFDVNDKQFQESVSKEGNMDHISKAVIQLLMKNKVNKNNAFEVPIPSVTKLPEFISKRQCNLFFIGSFIGFFR